LEELGEWPGEKDWHAWKPFVCAMQIDNIASARQNYLDIGVEQQ
jgi:hypothetical protein